MGQGDGSDSWGVAELGGNPARGGRVLSYMYTVGQAIVVDVSHSPCPIGGSE